MEPRHNEVLKYLLFFGACVACALGGFWVGRFTAPKNTQVETVYVNALPTLPPADYENVDFSEPVKDLITILFKANATGIPYIDTVAKFAFQYKGNLEGRIREALGEHKEGDKVVINSCIPSSTGENCVQLYSIRVFNNYDGGSRRVWLGENIVNYPNCTRYYKDISVAGKNGLIATSNCGSWGETYVLIPNGKQMIVYIANYNSRDEKTGEITLPDWLMYSLKTFRFL